MSNPSIWMVRAGRGAEYVDDFIENELVAIGFGTIEVQSDTDKSIIEARLKEANPMASPGKIGVSASQLKRYYSEINVGDAVMTYDPSQRLYFIGEIQSEVQQRDHILWRSRQVKWLKKVSRDSLQTGTRNTLGSTLTLFLVREAAAEDLWRHAVPVDATIEDVSHPQEISADSDEDRVLMEEVVTKSEEFIEDSIAKLDWEEMQELVAEILIAMGYRVRVTARGPDRGNDIFASPDGLGLQEPRIFVEVKHRPGTTMGANEVRSFIGGRRSGDRCLYVSTGGFSKEAKYEADRSSIPLTLITLRELRELLIEHYENMRPTGAALVPLQRIYWPA